MTETIIVILFFGGLVALFFWASKREKQHAAERAQGLTRLAESWGYSYQREGNAQLLAALSGFHEFKPDNSVLMTDVLMGTSSGFYVYGFEYTSYNNTTSKRSYPRWGTGIFKEGGRLPEFYLVPRRYRDEMWFARKWKKIDLSGHAELAKTHVLYGFDEAAVTRLLTLQLGMALAAHPTSYVEGKGAWLLMKRHETVGVEAVPAAITNGLELAALFFQSA